MLSSSGSLLSCLLHGGRWSTGRVALGARVCVCGPSVSGLLALLQTAAEPYSGGAGSTGVVELTGAPETYQSVATATNS